MTTNNPPAQDQPVTPQAEEWGGRFDKQFGRFVGIRPVKLKKKFSDTTVKSFNQEDIKSFIRQQLKSAHANGVEEGKKLMMEEIRNMLDSPLWSETKDTMALADCVDKTLDSLSPNQHKE